MSVALHVYLKPEGAKDTDPVEVELIFYAATEAEADKRRLAFMGQCAAYSLAEGKGLAVEQLEDDAVPLCWGDVEEEEGDDEEPVPVPGEDGEDGEEEDEEGEDDEG
jgi:hypothetical protein